MNSVTASAGTADIRAISNLELKNQWIDSVDPGGGMSEMGYKVGSLYDQKIFFLEKQGADSEVYVMAIFANVPESLGSGSDIVNFVSAEARIFRKTVNGSLEVIDSANDLKTPSLMGVSRNIFESPGAAGQASEGTFFGYARQCAEDFDSFVASPAAASGVSSLALGSPLGADYGGVSRVESRRCWEGDITLNEGDVTYDPAVQGQARQGGLGGFTGGVISKVGGEGIVYDDNAYAYYGNYWKDSVSISAYEAYERFLAGRTGTDFDTIINDRNWASQNGITIKRLTLKDGTETVGFSKDINGVTYTFAWDAAQGGHKLVEAKNAFGKDITTSALQKNPPLFRKTWDEISAALTTVSATGATLTPYGSEFSAESTSGSAEAPTAAEEKAYDEFKRTWSAYLTEGQITHLPDTKTEKTRMLSDLKGLNAVHVMQLFAGSKASGVTGLSRLLDLIEAFGIDSKSATKVAEWYGKLNFLIGRELARSPERRLHKDKNNDYWNELQKQLKTDIQRLVKMSEATIPDPNIRKSIFYSLALGLRNFSDEKARVSIHEFGPEQITTYLVKNIDEAVKASSGVYNRDIATLITAYGKQVLDTLSEFMSLKEMGFDSVLASSANKSDQALEDDVYQLLIFWGKEYGKEKLSNLFFGTLAVAASQVPEIQKQFEDVAEVSGKSAQNFMQMYLTLLQKLLDTISSAIRMIVGG